MLAQDGQGGLQGVDGLAQFLILLRGRGKLGQALVLELGGRKDIFMSFVLSQSVGLHRQLVSGTGMAAHLGGAELVSCAVLSWRKHDE